MPVGVVDALKRDVPSMLDPSPACVAGLHSLFAGKFPGRCGSPLGVSSPILGPSSPLGTAQVLN